METRKLCPCLELLEDFRAALIEPGLAPLRYLRQECHCYLSEIGMSCASLTPL